MRARYKRSQEEHAEKVAAIETGMEAVIEQQKEEIEECGNALLRGGA